MIVERNLTWHEHVSDQRDQVEVVDDLRVVQIGQRQVTQDAQALDGELLVVALGQDLGQVADKVLQGKFV